MGPPRVPPNSFLLKAGFGKWVAKKFFADSHTVAIECEKTSVKLVGTRFGDHHDLSAAVTELCRCAIGDDFELRNRVEGRHGATNRSLPMSLLETPSTVMFVEPIQVPPEINGVRSCALHTGSKREQRVHVSASVQRHGCDLVTIDNAAER